MASFLALMVAESVLIVSMSSHTPCNLSSSSNTLSVFSSAPFSKDSLLSLEFIALSANDASVPVPSDAYKFTQHTDYEVGGWVKVREGLKLLDDTLPKILTA